MSLRQRRATYRKPRKKNVVVDLEEIKQLIRSKGSVNAQDLVQEFNLARNTASAKLNQLCKESFVTKRKVSIPGSNLPGVVYTLAGPASQQGIQRDVVNRGHVEGVGHKKIRTQSKNVNRLLDRLEEKGVKLSRTSNSRVKLEVPNKPPMFVSSTPHSKSATHKVKTDARRILGLEI